MKTNATLSAYYEMTKPRIMQLVLVTTALGYYLGGKGVNGWAELLFLLIGTGSICAGSGVLNHFIERDFDKKMNRTKNRPIPAGVIDPAQAFQFGMFLCVFGIALLYIQVNILTSFLSLLTAFLYLMVYTPMKRVSWLNTTVGAIPGALPVLGGWAAATGTLNFEAGILYLILFLWQHPHFYAIAWMCKDDYKRGGFQMLPVIDPDGKRTAFQIKMHSLLLIPVSIALYFTGTTGVIYLIGALCASSYLCAVGFKFCVHKTMKDAKSLLMATVIYLPVLLVVIVVDIVIL